MTAKRERCSACMCLVRDHGDDGTCMCTYGDAAECPCPGLKVAS